MAAPGASRDVFDRDRYIYNDLLRRSGAVVFSSSRGTEYSYETDELHNGVFTAAIVRALTTDQADANRDGVVSTEELRQYVAREVAKQTAEAQHPTVDHDNTTVRFGFPIARAVANEPETTAADAPSLVATRGLVLEPNARAPVKMCPDPVHPPVGCACHSGPDATREGSAAWLAVAMAAVGWGWRRRSRLSPRGRWEW
jgi:MYXO-CTERM domain-containing protein